MNRTGKIVPRRLPDAGLLSPVGLRSVVVVVPAVAVLCSIAFAEPLTHRGTSSENEAPRRPAQSRPAKPADYAPGVRINWDRLEVEINARIVLRDGLIELFACSTNTREHESILAVDARPLHIFESMGLIGLEPGRPVRLDRKTDAVRPAFGQRLDVRVRYVEKDRTVTVPIHEWMWDAKRDRPMTATRWLFCGSRTLSDGAFGADRDGTVACVVDFDTALIGLAESHSSDDTLLWLSANPRRIPPVGTACTLIVRSAGTASVPATSPVPPSVKRNRSTRGSRRG